MKIKTNKMEKLAKIIIKGRVLIIAVTVILTVALGYNIKDLKINADTMSLLPDDDPIALLYKNIGKKFGGNDMGMIVLETDNIFKKEALEHIKQITDTLKITNGVSTVTSLTNVINIKGNEDGIEISKLIDEYNIPDTEEELSDLKNTVFSKEMYKGSIVSDDGTLTLIIFTLLENADKPAVSKNIKDKITQLQLPEKLYFGGLPIMMNDMSDLISSDMARLIPITFFLIALILFLSFRSARGVILPLLTAGISVVWSLGFMVVLGYELTMISNTIPIILLAIGSAYTIHVINRINSTFATDRKTAIINALTYIILPVILASLTTVAGFLSFIFGSYLTMIKDFGIFTALGVFFALLLSVFFVPAIISVLSLNKKNIHQTENNRKSILSDYFLTPLKNLLFKHYIYILTAWGFLIIIGILGVFFIKSDANMNDDFKKDNPIRISDEIMQQKFGGSLPVFVVFKGDIQSPEVLKIMVKTADYMKKNPYIKKTQSVADLIKEMNDVMGEGKKIPDEKAKIEQLWFLLDGQDVMSQLVTDELDEAIIQSQFASPKNEDMKLFIDDMNRFIRENLTNNCKIEITGMPHIYDKLNISLINSQASSVLLAIALMLIIVGLLFRSFSNAVYAIIPIIVTITILLGFMGYYGIKLDFASVLVASIALGIGIDYSIHIIISFNHSLKKTGDIFKALENTIMFSGKAVIINVVSVAAGFLVLLFSELVPLQNFGLLVALSMLGSGLSALTLLPSILLLANRKKL